MEETDPFTTQVHIKELEVVAGNLIKYASGCKIWLFTGDLGAGKTTLIQSICKQLGITSYVTSPTFSLINTYHLPSREPVYHIDAYRLKNEQEATEIDFPFYLETGSYCFIEWPNNIPSYLLTIPNIHIHIIRCKSDAATRKLFATLILV